MIHLLLINLSVEASCMVWRSAQHVWNGRATVQSMNIQMALDFLRHLSPFEQAPCPSLIMLATGAQGDWDTTIIKQLKEALTACSVPLVGLADTSRAMDRLHARRAPLDAVLLNPVQADALQELARALKLNGLQMAKA